MAFAFTQAQVSTMRINDIKLGMSKTEVEKLIGKKIIIKLSEYNYPEDAVNIVHKGIAYSIFFNYDGEKTFNVTNITSKDPSLKTLSGVKYGDSLETLFNKYKGYNFRVYQLWDHNSEKRDPNQRVFSIEDGDNGSSLDFTLKNNKIVSYSVMYVEGC